MDSNSRIYLIGPDGAGAMELVASRYEREADFQRLLAEHPALLDGEQFDPVNPRRWLLVGREVVVPDAESDRWSLDLLFVDQDGVATLVEVKRKSDTRLRREVVAQMLEYAANGSTRWTAEFLQATFERRCDAQSLEPLEQLRTFLGEEERVPAFWDGVVSNLKAGRMRLVFVADEIPDELLRIVEFMNLRMVPTEVLALELRYFSGSGYSTHVPRVLGRTAAATAQKESAGGRAGEARRRWTREDFLRDAEGHLGAGVARALEAFLDRCSERFEIAWGTGALTGSFTPRRPALSARGPISVYSDGRLEIKPSWLTDTPEAEAWRARVTPKLAALGWLQPMGEKKEVSLKVRHEEWLPKADALLQAIE